MEPRLFSSTVIVFSACAWPASSGGTIGRLLMVERTKPGRSSLLDGAELLHDIGYQVTLTQATRDGGKDILASMRTELGEFLCLVEAKHYREDRKIGVSLVRTLYGTLCDYQASSAMLVTTSSYSKDAQALQKKHKYELSLRDYTDVAGWIQRYGTHKTS